MRINYRLGWLAVGGRGGRRAGSRVPLDGGRDTKQKGEDEAVVSADLQTNEHASERDGQPADLSDILRYIEDARSFVSQARAGRICLKRGGGRPSLLSDDRAASRARKSAHVRPPVCSRTR